MSRAIILQHVPFEGPGRIVPAFRDFGIPCEVRHLYKGDEVPSDLDELRVLVILGGPMGVADIGGGRYPYLAREIDLLKRIIARDRATLGVCLGAQLIAPAAGAKVYPNVKMGAPADIEAVLANASAEVKKALPPDGLDRIREQTQAVYPRYARMGDRVLRNFVQYLKVY